MNTLTYETTRGNTKTVVIVRTVGEVLVTANDTYYYLSGHQVLASRNGSKPRKVGYPV